MHKLIRVTDLRWPVLIAAVAALQACGNLALPARNDGQQVEQLLAFQQTVARQDASALRDEARELREQLDGQDNPTLRLQLQMIEQRLDHLAALETEREQQQSLRRQIQSLAEQIQALTAIEQQINQREQRQENSNGAR